MNKLNLSLIILISFFTLSCQSIKDGLSGTKNENSDEFLVQKKNPLVLPPNYMELPEPKSKDIENDVTLLEDETEIEKLFKSGSDINQTESKSFGKAEDFVLENIKNPNAN
mgnify:CR=1 FL=1